MSPLTLLIVASLVAALAFFLAGLLLAAGRGGDGAARKEARQREVLETELENLRRERAQTEEALAEAQAQRKSEEGGREREEARRAVSEAERDSARLEAQRLAARERTLAERLRIAEDENRAAFEREEKNAEAWAGQLEAAKAEQKRHDGAVRHELEQLRAEVIRHKAERERLSGESRQHAARADEALRALEELRSQTQARVRKQAEESEQADGRAQEAAAVEQGLRERIAELEAEKARLAQEFEHVRAEPDTRREELDSLKVRLRAAEEVAAHEREQVGQAAEAARTAEARAQDRERLAQENAVLREQQAQAGQEARQQAGREDELRDAKVELAAAQAKLAELGRALEENSRLRDEVAELRTHEEASGELARLTAVHKQVRLDAELMARRLQELLRDQAELAPLRAQAAEAAALADEVAYLRQREKDLEAQLYASGFYASREMAALSSELLVQTPVTDLESGLSMLVGEGGPRTAVLADAQGFLIAGAGESVAQEGLAAFAAVAGEMVARARMLLPLASIESVRVTDANSMVLTCHLFDSAGEKLGVATLGPGEPKADSTARAIVGLGAIVSGVESGGGKGEPEPSG
jgi:hypothetical protein